MYLPNVERYQRTSLALDSYCDDLLKGILTKDHMVTELLRVKTFKPIPNNFYRTRIWPTTLARAGFYFDQGSEETVCFECDLRTKFSFWVKGTDPIAYHRNASPDCRYIFGESRENVPFLTDEQRRNGTSYLERKNGFQRPPTTGSSNQSVVADSPSFTTVSFPSSDGDRSLISTGQTGRSSEVIMSLPESRYSSDTRHDEPPFQSLPVSTDSGRGTLVSDHPNVAHTSDAVRRVNADGNDNRSTPPRDSPGTYPRPINNTPVGPTSLPVRNSNPGSTFPSAGGSTSSHSGDPRNLGDGPDALQMMRSEEARLRTFTRWPTSASVAPVDLARAGFFYTGSTDRVQCAFCENVLRNWEPNDNPMFEHRRHFPRCRFVLGQDVGNIPIQGADRSQPQTHFTTTSGGMMPASQGPPARPPFAWSAPPMTRQQLQQPPPSGPNPMGVNTELPKHPEYAIESSRLLTYRTWRPGMPQSADLLCKAGFYYTGQDDNVRCFFCDGGLRNWEREDDPFTEHARWFPRCSFIREVRGNAFVDALATRYPRTQNMPNMPAEEPVSDPTQRTTSAPASSSSSNAAVPGIQYRIEEREIKARMDTPAVRAVLDMGFDRSLVLGTIRRQLRDRGEDFSSAEQLLEALFAHEENRSDEEQPPAPEDQLTAGSSGQPGGGDPPPADRTQSAPTPSNPPATSTPASSGTPAQHSEGATANVTENSAGGTSTGKSRKKKKQQKQRKQAEGGAGAETPSVEEAAQDEGNADSTETRTLLEENRALKDQRMCKVCMDAEANIVFLPCGHLVCCANCAPALRNCAVCRSLIRGTVRTYLS